MPIRQDVENRPWVDLPIPPNIWGESPDNRSPQSFFWYSGELNDFIDLQSGKSSVQEVPYNAEFAPRKLRSWIDRSAIHAVVNLIVERFDPDQIVLFGSHARNEAGKHSDVDLLVVVREDTECQRQRGNPVRRAIAERFVLPVDVIIHSQESIARKRDDPYSLINTILNEGEVLYERSGT